MTKKFIEAKEIWKDEFEIASYHMDPFGYLKLSSLFELIQDAASKDAARKGFGYTELIAEDKYWVLLRALLRINRIPRWEEDVVFKTWPKESTGVVAFRDFVLESSEGEELIKITSSWSQLNAISRRPIRIEFGDEYHPLNNLNAIVEKPAKIALPDDLNWSEEILVKYSQIDVNRHVNNTRYLEWVLNELPFALLQDQQILEMEVNFLSEGMLGDKLRVGYKQQSADEWVACVERNADGKKVYAVRFLFASR